jgi:hypothetical protein
MIWSVIRSNVQSRAIGSASRPMRFSAKAINPTSSPPAAIAPRRRRTSGFGVSVIRRPLGAILLPPG